MSSVVRHYNRKPNQVEAVQVSAENVDYIANWCGGKVDREEKPGDPTDVRISLSVPNINGNRTATIGHFVVREDDGKFWVRHAEEFLGEYEIPTRTLHEEVRQAHIEGVLPKAPTPHYVSRGAYDRG